MPSNFDMIENVYGRDAAESVRKMMDLAQEAVNKVHELYAQINAKDAEMARLRDALRPFAAAVEYAVYDPLRHDFRIDDWLCTSKENNHHSIMISPPDNWLKVRHLRAAYLALRPDDTGGDGDA